MAVTRYGLCDSCIDRYRRGGAPRQKAAVASPLDFEPQLCTVEGCDALSEFALRGYCRAHFLAAARLPDRRRT